MGVGNKERELTSFSCGKYLMHPIRSLNIGIASPANEQQIDAIDFNKFIKTEATENSKNGTLRTKGTKKVLKKSQIFPMPIC